MTFRILPLLLASALALAGAQPVRVETRTDALPMGARLWIIQGDGKVDVQGWDRPEVQLTAEFIRTPEGQETKLEVSRVDGGLKVEVHHPRRHNFNLFNLFRGRQTPVCNLTLKVPRRLSMDVRAVDGGIRVQDLEGYAGCHTVDGAITVENVQGEVHARAVDGSITARNLRARMQGGTVDGSITLDHVEGGLKLDSVDGSITAQDLDGWGEGIELKTVDGHLRVRLGQAKGIVEAKAVDGRISNRAPGLNLTGRPNHLKGSLPGRSQSITLSSVDGNIDIE
jgi:DUF4097 and DUF4098 domain-containing protein YvlB